MCVCECVCECVCVCICMLMFVLSACSTFNAMCVYSMHVL